jgi:hypothetical protein
LDATDRDVLPGRDMADLADIGDLAGDDSVDLVLNLGALPAPDGTKLCKHNIGRYRRVRS